LIASLPNYEELWIGWWTSLQPDWRNTGSWPLPRSPSADGSWDELLVGGKDGLFIVVMSLSWWIVECAKGEGESEESELEEALADISWVLSNLVSVLSAGDTEPTSPPASTRSLLSPSTKKSRHATSVLVSASPGGSQRRPQRTAKIGPPKKRSRVR